LPKSAQVRSYGNNVPDVIIAHMISVDAQTYRCGKRKAIQFENYVVDTRHDYN